MKDTCQNKIFFYGLLSSVLVNFLQRDIDKFEENVRQTKLQKRFIYGQKRKVWNRGKRTQMPVTITEELRPLVVFAGELRR